MPQLDVSLLRGLRPAVLLDLLLLTGLLEEPEGPGALRRGRAESETATAAAAQRSELERRLDEDIARIMQDEETQQTPTAGTAAMPREGEEATREDGAKHPEEPSEQKASPKTPKPPGMEAEACAPLPTPALQPARPDFFALELRAVRLSYLLLGALKSLAVILGSGRLADLLLVPRPDSASPSSSSAGPSSLGTEATQSPGTGEEGPELRSVLQFVVRSMVKWAVRPCPIKHPVALADLERAQVMIYKGVLNRLHQDGSNKDHRGMTWFGGRGEWRKS